MKAAFLHAVTFCRPLLSYDATGATNSTHGGLGGGSSPAPSPSASHSGAPNHRSLLFSDADKLAFYANFKQATHGDCPEPANDDDLSMMMMGAAVGGDHQPPHNSGGAATSSSSIANAASASSSAAMASGASSLTPHAPALDPALVTIAKCKRDAWLRCKGMRRRDAMKAFVSLLDSLVPTWEDSVGKA